MSSGRRVVMLLAALQFVACATGGRSLPPLISAIGRDDAIALATASPLVGRVDQADAKLLTLGEYLATAGPLLTHQGDPSATPTTGLGLGDGDRNIWAIAVLGQIWPAGRVPDFFGMASPPSATPYPPYRWAILIADARTGHITAVVNAGTTASWPVSFDTLPSHPRAG